MDNEDKMIRDKKGRFVKGHKFHLGRRRNQETIERMKIAGQKRAKKMSDMFKGRNNYWLEGDKNPNKRLEARKRVSKQMKRQWKEGITKPNQKGINAIIEWRKTAVFPKKDTSIEVKIQNFLKILGIEFFTHQYMKIEHGYQCDILIPSMNLVIECDGDYWHKYSTGRDIDHIRTSELLSKGFKVLRLWENEIKIMELNDFKEKLICYS